MTNIIQQYPYLAAVTLFLIALYCVLAKPNFVKKLIGLGLMVNSINLFFITLGYREVWPNIPIAPVIPHGLREDISSYVSLAVDPLPQCLVLTAIVIDMAVTAFAVALIIAVYRIYGSVDERRVRRLAG
ncbi:MAG: sodium:proton antiporter [Candidatus Nezhaarchaeales archaeon]